MIKHCENTAYYEELSGLTLLGNRAAAVVVPARAQHEWMKLLCGALVYPKIVCQDQSQAADRDVTTEPFLVTG